MEPMLGPLGTGDHCLPSHHVQLQPRSATDCTSRPCVIVHVVTCTSAPHSNDHNI